MAGQESSDEYRFDDSDLLASEPGEPGSEPTIVQDEPSASAVPFTLSPVLRNSLLVTGGLIAVIVAYELIAGLFPAKKTSMSPAMVSSPATFTAPPVRVVKSVTPPVVNPHLIDVSGKIATIEQDQKEVVNSVNSVGSQLSGVASSIEGLSAQISQLNAALSTLNDKIELQADVMQRVLRAATPKHHRAPKLASKAMPMMHYALQAIIPGRAWLVAENGSTLTVREGSQLAGYGFVRTVDAEHGRVVMSSGQVIRFSQADS